VHDLQNLAPGRQNTSGGRGGHRFETNRGFQGNTDFHPSMGGNSNYVHGETSPADASNYANQRLEIFSVLQVIIMVINNVGMLTVVCSIVLVIMWLICNQGVVLMLTYSSRLYGQLLQQLLQPTKLQNQSRVHLLQQILILGKGVSRISK
jgi:hypothetical protein